MTVAAASYCCWLQAGASPAHRAAAEMASAAPAETQPDTGGPREQGGLNGRVPESVRRHAAPASRQPITLSDAQL